MPVENLCPHCDQVVEDGAIFCGNCGFKLDINTQNSIGQGIPAYDVPKTHHKQHWAAMALVFGIVGIAGSVLVPLLGLIFGITGVILATASMRLTHGWLKPVSVTACICALLISVAFWVNNAAHNVKLTSVKKTPGTSNGVITISVTTPCYTLTFNSELNVNNDNGSCSLNAYNGSSFATSSDVYKVVASQASSITSTNFDSISKQSIEADVSKKLSGFNIEKEVITTFDSSPAYAVTAYNSSTDVSVIEESILNTSLTKDNFFVIVHAVNGQSIDLGGIQSSWHWNS